MSLLEKATTITTPTAHSNGVLHSIKGGAVADFDVVRGSAATRVNAEGLIEDVVANIPRIDYTDGTASILLEPQSTNLIPYSEDFSDASWTKNAVTLESGYLAPDGTNSAYKVTSAGTQAHLYASADFTGIKHKSIYARTLSGTGEVNLCNRYSDTNALFTITEQWQRFDISHSDVDLFYAVDFRASGGTLSEVIIWGAQFEALPYATSYIPTSGAIATRLADSVTGAGDASTFNSTEGVLYFEGSALAVDGIFRVLGLSDGTTANRVYVGYSSFNTITCSFQVSSSVVYSFDFTTDISVNSKMALKYKENDFALWVNGVEVNSQSSGNTFPVGVLTQMQFTSATTSSPFYGKVKSVITFDTALTDAELECLTTI